MEWNDNEKWVVEATVPDEVYTDLAEFLDYFYEAALNGSPEDHVHGEKVDRVAFALEYVEKVSGLLQPVEP